MDFGFFAISFLGFPFDREAKFLDSDCMLSSCFLIDVGSYTASIGYFERIIKLEPPELFRLYHSYRKKIEELPNRNNIIEDILKKLSEYVPASGKPRVDLLKRTGSEMGDLSPKDKKRKKFRPERSFKKIGRRKLSKPEKVNQSN